MAFITSLTTGELNLQLYRVRYGQAIIVKSSSYALFGFTVQKQSLGHVAPKQEK
jgi:hypothetical protein